MLIVCPSCSSQNNSAHVLCELQSDYYYFEFDSINYPKAMYSENFYTLNDTDYYIYFNDECNCFYIRNLFNNDIIDTVVLNHHILKEFPFTRFNDSGVIPISNDSIILFYSEKLICIDGNLQVIDSIMIRKEIKLKSGKKLGNKINIISHSPNLPYYFSETGELLVSLQYNYNEKFSNMYVEGLLNIHDKSFKYVPVKFPEKYDIGNYAVVPTNFHRTISGTKIIYTFGIVPDIFVYDILKDTVIVYNNCKSTYQVGGILPIQKMKKQITNDDMYNYEKYDQHYHNIGYDKISGNYYRIFRPQMSVKNENGEYNTFIDKKMILQVLDSNFNLICEQDLNNPDYHSWYMLSTSKGMAYSVTNKKKKYSLKFRIIK